MLQCVNVYIQLHNVQKNKFTLICMKYKICILIKQVHIVITKKYVLNSNTKKVFIFRLLVQ